MPLFEKSVINGYFTDVHWTIAYQNLFPFDVLDKLNYTFGKFLELFRTGIKRMHISRLRYFILRKNGSTLSYIQDNISN